MSELITLSADELWKGIIEALTKEFVAFFLPDIYPLIDFDKGYDFIEQELHKLFSESETTRRFNDKLLKVFLKDQTEIWILIHIEIQGYYDVTFSQRMFEYYYRIYDRYGKETVAIAIFTDDKKGFLPKSYNHSFGGTEIMYKYRTYKILKQKETKLLRQDNPFSLVVLAAKYALSTQDDNKKRSKFKFKLIRLLLERKYDLEIINKIFTFVAALLNMPKDLELKFSKQVDELIKKEKPMELKFEYTSTYHAWEAELQELREINREKDQILREKDQILREKDKEKDREKEEITTKTVIGLYKKNFPPAEIADCMQITEKEVIAVLQKTDC